MTALNKSIACFLSSLLFLTLFFGSSEVHEYISCNFCEDNIIKTSIFQKEWDTASISVQEEQNINQLISQKFTYLGKGHQCYAFLSEDGQYVLKFFKTKHHGILNENKIRSIFQGYKLAYDLDKTNCGLIYLHLNPTTHLHKSITLIDKYGFSHTLNLNNAAFLIQYKVKLTKQLLAEILKKGDISAAKKLIEQIFDVYVTEYKKFLYDRDHNVMQNSGFLNDQFIHMDVGMLRYNPDIAKPENFLVDLNKIAWKRIDKWVKKNYPQYREEIATYMKTKLEGMN